MVRQRDLAQLAARLEAAERRLAALEAGRQETAPAERESEEERRRRERMERQFAALFAYDGRRRAGDE